MAKSTEVDVDAGRGVAEVFTGINSDALLPSSESILINNTVMILPKTVFCFPKVLLETQI